MGSEEGNNKKKVCPFLSKVLCRCPEILWTSLNSHLSHLSPFTLSIFFAYL